MKDAESGISIRFVEKWDIIPDPNPHAFSLLVCPDCLSLFEGFGQSLSQSMASAEELRKAHKCSHLQEQGHEQKG